MERQRTLTKVVNLRQLHNELAAASPSFQGLCASDGRVGDILRIVGADDLSDAQVDAILAAHVPIAAPDWDGFAADVQGAFTRRRRRQALSATTLFALQARDATGVKQDVDEMREDNVITPPERDLIYVKARARNIPGF